jgi:DtxR family transcriptional regulator, Mn-dependent transcriptional regulator
LYNQKDYQVHTLSEENYLKAIYRLSQERDKKITPTAIAEVLDNNPASVIDMLKKLSEKNLINYDKTKGAVLKKLGKAIAIEVVRRHRLWEVFLVQKLGYTWDAIHDIAEQLEHIQHPDLADRLDKFLDFPSYDPHGDPIPKSNGEVPAASSLTLEEVEIGRTCQVVGVKDSSTAFLQYLKQLNVGIGTSIQIQERITYDDSLIIKIEEILTTTVSNRFGKSILVK